MAISVVMPALEMAQETGTLLNWLKKEGEAVAKGEPLLEIETDKAVVEVEALAQGILAGVTARVGDVVPVGHTIAWIVQPGEKPPAAGETKVDSPAVVSTAAIARPQTTEAPAAAPSSAEIQISPKARRLAQERGVDLKALRGTGPGGEILASDVEAAVSGAAAGKAATTEHKPLSPIARLMAERTTEGWTKVPHFFLVREVDASGLAEAKERLAADAQAKYGVKPTYTDLLVALVGQVLRKHPRMNSSWTNGEIRQNSEVNVSVAMAVEGGIVAPVVHAAGTADLGSISVAIRALAERARASKLRPQDVSGGTFTISNLGMFGIDAFSAVITPPQAGILAVGRIADRVVAVNGSPVVRPMMTFTLSADHRVTDGAKAALFLKELVEAVESPMQFLETVKL